MKYENILDAIPIRKPFLLIDDIINIKPGNLVIGRKKVSTDEFWAKVHFINEPVFPGALMLETMAQIASFIFFDEQNPSSVGSYFLSANKVKFIRKVVPDCDLIVTGNLIYSTGLLFKVECSGTVDGIIVAKGEITLRKFDE